MSKQFYFKTIQFSMSMYLNVKTILFQATQFSSIWPKDRTPSGATTPGQSGPGSDGNEEVHNIPQSSSITGTSPSDCLVSYPGYQLGAGGKSYSSAEMQSVFSTVPADWTKNPKGNSL